MKIAPRMLAPDFAVQEHFIWHGKGVTIQEAA
jgi:hypothetical protein